MKCKLLTLKDGYFLHLEQSELNIMREREKSNVGFCFAVLDGHGAAFYVFIDIDAESVHVRHIGGAFAWKWGYIENLCHMVAREAGLNKITVCADKDFMFHALKKLGFKHVQDDLYGKEI